MGRPPPSITEALTARLAAAKPGSPVGLELRLDSARARDLPWELLADAEGALALRAGYRVWRNIPTRVAAPPLTVRPPLRVVVVLTNPSDEAVPDPHKELETIAQALTRPGYE